MCAHDDLDKSTKSKLSVVFFFKDQHWSPEIALPNERETTIASCSGQASRNFSRLYTDEAEQGIPKSVGGFRTTLNIYPRQWLRSSVFRNKPVRSCDIHL